VGYGPSAALAENPTPESNPKPPGQDALERSDGAKRSSLFATAGFLAERACAGSERKRREKKREIQASGEGAASSAAHGPRKIDIHALTTKGDSP